MKLQSQLSQYLNRQKDNTYIFASVAVIKESIFCRWSMGKVHSKLLLQRLSKYVST